MSNCPPRPQNIPMIEHLFAHKRGNLFAGMGLGKTGATLSALDSLRLVEEGPTLVMAPLRVAQTTWPDEVKKWGFDMPIPPIVGTAAQRPKALREESAIFTI